MSKHTPDSSSIQLPLPIDGATIEIPLTKGYTTVIDAVDADLVGLRWFTTSRDPYAARSIRRPNANSERILMHRVIVERMIGRKLAKNEEVDHINCDSLDNRRSNLRIASHAENQRNAHRDRSNTSGYKGVSKASWGNKWQASITVNGKQRGLGYFDTPEQAHEAYCKAAKELHGEFARFE